MKILATLTILTWIFALDVLGDERELPIDSQLPQVGNDWVRRDDAGATGPYSWVNFDHRKNPGEVLSFVAWKVPSSMKVTAGPVGQTSIEAFKSNGSARHSTSNRGMPIADTLRHRYVTIHVEAKGINHEIDAIEYTYVYEADGNSAATMAHGYCTVVGETVVSVQHTSDKPITSELAFDMAGGLLSKRFQLAGKPHSFSRGKILQSNN